MHSAEKQKQRFAIIHMKPLAHASNINIQCSKSNDLAGPCRDLWRGMCSKYKRGTWYTALNRAVLLADMCIEMDPSALIQQHMP